VPTNAERERRQKARRHWAVYRQYLHELSPEFRADWHALITQRAKDCAPLDAPFEERLCDSPAVKALEATIRWDWPEAPWDLYELRPDECWNPELSQPADPAFHELWERHRKALEPPRGKRIKEPTVPLTIARGCFLGCNPWNCLPATSIYYRRLVVWDLYQSPKWVKREDGSLEWVTCSERTLKSEGKLVEWMGRPDRRVWAVASVLFPDDPTIDESKYETTSEGRSEIQAKLVKRLMDDLDAVENDLRTLRNDKGVRRK
jgi:hypothetical protein